MRFNRIPNITWPINAAAMQSYFPSFTLTRQQGVCVWRGTLQPSEGGTVYFVKISLKDGGIPEVYILKPKLSIEAPHLYSKGKLCLYYPDDRTWHSGLLLARIIVPLTAVWLRFYEIWQDTGEWWGSAAPHEPSEIKQ